MKQAPARTASIRGRLLRTQLLWSLLWGLALAGAVWLAAQSEVDELLDDTLQSAAEGLIGPMLAPYMAAAPTARVVAPPHVAVPPGTASAGQRFVWQLVGPGPVAPVLASADGAPLQAVHSTPSVGFSDVSGWRVYGQSLGQDGHVLYVAQSRAERSEIKLEVIFTILLAGLPMALLGLLWLNARVRHDLQPLQDLSLRLADYDPLHPGATLGAAGYQELQPMHAAIDALATRLTQRMAHERAFTAHAAHALRTPLAGIDAQLAVALREAPPALQPRLQRVRDASNRLQRVVVALLAMFRSGAEVQRGPLDLATLVARLPVAGLALRVLTDEQRGEEPAKPLNADPDLLTAALLNLFDNAARHGALTVTLSAPAVGVLQVHDDGSGVTPERRAALQQALDEQDYAGRMGLGLMLADLVARAHGGALSLPDAGPGFTAVLRLQPA